MKVRYTLKSGTIIALWDKNGTSFVADFADGKMIRIFSFDDIREAIASFSNAVEDDNEEKETSVFFKLIRRAASEGYNIRTGKKGGNLIEKKT